MKAPHCVMAIRPDKTAIICAWCPDKIAGETFAQDRGYDISHGVCPACTYKLESQQAQIVSQEINVKYAATSLRTEAEILRRLNGE